MLRLLLTLILLCACAYLSVGYSHEQPEHIVTVTARRANKAHLAAPTGTIATFAAQQRATASRMRGSPTVESDTLFTTSTPSGTSSKPAGIELLLE